MTEKLSRKEKEDETDDFARSSHSHGGGFGGTRDGTGYGQGENHERQQTDHQPAGCGGPFVAGEDFHSWKKLSLLAEDGDPTALAGVLEGSAEVLDYAVAGGPLMPGATMVFELESEGQFNRVSAVGMLVTTNDAFFGLDNFVVGRFTNKQVPVPAWDAGTEFNNELCSFIPGPPCGSPLVRDTDDAEGLIHIHPGLQGVGDLEPADWNWQNPAVLIRIVKK
jgi:hypothetical protein